MIIYIALIYILRFAAAGRKCCPKLGCYTSSGAFSKFPPPDCPSAYKPVTFTLYLQPDQEIPLELPKNMDKFIPENPTVFIVHGFQSKKRASWVQELKDEFLKKAAYNVIIVDWEKLATVDILSPDDSYQQAASSTRVVGELLLRKLALLRSRKGSGTFWCVGHSLGAHTCGHAGRVNDYKWDRITGLDPAGRLFDDSPPEAGLQPNQAHFVDVIHTNGKKRLLSVATLGTLRPMGHVDFYPNGGGRQPGCVINKRSPSKTFGKIFACSHRRAYKYFTESINSKCGFFITCRCTDKAEIPDSCNRCLGKTEISHCGYNKTVCQKMGFHAVPDHRGSFYIKTHSSSPYCIQQDVAVSYSSYSGSNTSPEHLSLVLLRILLCMHAYINLDWL